MPTTILEIDSLTKAYGSFYAVNSLNLRIERGEIFGLLGPNGSGKTTTLGMILDVISPSSGSYSWFGEPAGTNQRRRIGAILEKPNFYPSFSAQTNLEVSCKIKRANPDRIPEVLEIVGLLQRKDDNFKTYSLGMKQRLAIASALLNEPEVLILDEPTNGLDPEGIAEIRQIIIDIAHTGKTIILASHLLDEVQKVCNTFGVLKRGRLIHHGKVQEDLQGEKAVEVSHPSLSKLATALTSIPGYKSVDKANEKLIARFDPDTEWLDISSALGAQGVHPTLFAPRYKTLEEQFLEILSDDA